MKKIYLFIILLLINISAFSQVTLPYAYDFEGDSLSSGWNKYPEPDGGSCYNTLFFGLQDGYFVFLSQYRIFGGCGDDYRQYLVTPKLINNTSDSVQIRFKCKALQPINSASYAPEAFVIGYFTENQYASVDDFIWSEDTVYTTNYTEWQTFVYNLPPTADYVAIAYTSEFSSGLMIDDVVLRTNTIRYTITLDVAENGRIVPDGGETRRISVPLDTTVGFRIYPDEGYFINYVAVNEVRLWDNPDTITLANIRDNQLIQVTFAPHQYVVVAKAGEGGSIAPSDSVPVAGGQSAQFHITANPGYVIDSVFVDDVYIAAPHLQTSYDYTFPSVVDDHTITVSFLHQPYIVHYTTTGHGTLTVTGGVSVGLDSVCVYYEDTLTFHFVPDEGYELADLQLNGASVGVSNPYVLTHLLKNCLFHVVFEEKTFNIVSYSHNLGTITPSATGIVGYLDTVRLAVTPYFCMQVDSILFDGNSMAVADTLCFTHLEGSHVLDAYFSQIHYAIQVQPVEHGTIVGNGSVVCGGTARFRILPDPCYRVAHFYWDGELRDDLLRAIDDTFRVTIPNISADYTVSAVFERLEYQVSVTSSGNGSVSSLAPFNVLCDSTIPVEAIPDECHYVASFMVNGTDVINDVHRIPSGQDGFGDTVRYDLTGIREDQSVSVEFRQFVFPLVVNAGPNGTASITDTVWMVCGQDTTLRFVPDECYQVDSVVLDNEWVTQGLVSIGDTVFFTIQNIHSPHNLNVSFGLKHYTVSIISGQNGEIVPSEDTLVECGGSLPLVFVPASCYRIDTVWLDGNVVNSRLYYKHNVDHHFGDSAFFTLNEITEAHEVRASFKRMVYNHSITTIGNGNVTSTVTGTNVYCGEEVTVTMTPDDCHQIKKVYLNNEPFTDYQVDENGVGSCYFPEVVGDLYLSVEFEQKYHSITVIADQSANGEIIAPDTAIPCGNDVQLQFVPDECYHLDSVRIGDEWIQMENRIAAGDTFSYLLQNIHLDYVIDASFSIDSVHFIVSGGAPMSVSDTVLACGQRLKIYTIQDICDRLDSIVWNGRQYWLDDFPAGDIYYSFDTLYFNMYPLRKDYDMSVCFSPIAYKVRPHITGEGTVGAVSFNVMCDDSLAIHIFPFACHHLESVNVSDGCSYTLLGDSLLVVRDLWRNLDISFTFVPDRYEVQLSYNSDLGTVAGTAGMVDCGTDLVYTFNPATCAKLDSVFLDGVCVNERLDSSSGLSLVIDSISADHDLRAVFSGITVSVDVLADEHSYAVATPRDVFDCGEDFTLYIEPVGCHYISEVLLDGASILGLLNHEGDGYTFSLYRVRQNHRFEVFSAPLDLPVIVNRLTENGDVLSSDTAYVLCGGDTTLAATPFDDCYVIDSVYLNDVTMDVQSEYFCSSISGPTTLNVFMHRIEYRIEVTDYAHCSITEGQSLQMVLCDSSLHLAFVPDEGYRIISLVVDDEEIPAAPYYDFLNVHENHTIEVKTEIYHFMVRTSSVGAGSVSPDSVAVDYGDSAELRIVFGECQYLSQVTVNGQSYLDSVSYGDDVALLVIHRITDDQAVLATFEQSENTVRCVAGAGGSVIPSSATVLCGETYHFYILAADCYHPDTVFLNGVPITEGWYLYNDDTLGFDIPDVRTDMQVEVSFAKDVKSIVLDNGEGGTVRLSDTTFLCGGGYSLQIIPDICRTLESVTINGVNVMQQLTYMGNIYLPMPDTAVYEVTGAYDDQMIQIVYGIEHPHHIGVTFLSDGNVLSYSDIEIACGEDTLVSLMYDCYTLDSLFVDGIRIVPEEKILLVAVVSNHTIEAYFSRNRYEIVAIDAPHGSIAPSDTTTVACGANKTYLITPDEGYYIEALIVDGEQTAPTATYTFTDVRENHTIEPVFVTYTYTVDVEIVGAGSVTPGDTVVAYGSDVHYDIVAADCHSIDSVVVNGTNRGAVDFYDFVGITGPQTLTAYFSLNGYTAVVGTAEHGRVVLDTNFVDCGGSVGFTVIPDTCYALDSVMVNGANVGAVASYTIENIRENQVVDAYFSQIVYSVTVADGIQHGTVTPSAEQVLCGGEVTLSVQPDACYSVDSVLVNGVNVGDAYIISDIREDQLVTAFFSINAYMVEVTAGDHGTATNTGENTVTCGNDFVVTIAPDDCYQVGTVMVDGQSVALQGSELRFENVAADHQVEVTFERTVYVQQVTSGFGGAVMPAAPSVSCGDNQTFVITPINCYHIDTVWINGAMLPSDSLTFNGEEASFTLYDVRQINEIAVTFAGNQYQFTVDNHGHGTVHLEQNSVECDGEATFYILPAACEQISSVSLSGVDIFDDLDFHTNENPLLPDTAFYTINQMNEDKLLVIDYLNLPNKNLSVIYTDGSATLYAADSILACGDSILLDLNYDCYVVDSVILDDENLGQVQSLTVESNLSDRMAVAYFSMNEYEISVTATEGGNIVPDGPLTVFCGGNRSFNIVNDPCYDIDSVVVNGVNEGVVSSVALDNIREDQTVSAFFSRTTHTVEVLENEGGTVTLDGPSSVACDGSVAISVTPESCFTIDSVVVNGVLLGNETSYTIDNITENQTVAAYFSRNVYAVTSETVGNGTITPEGVSELACGSEITYTIAPAVCHQIDSVLVNGVNLGAVPICTVTGTDELGDQNVKAYFSARTYGLSLTAGAGGAVLPAGDTTVVCGANLSVSILPNECYDIENVTVDSVDMGALSSYVFENIEAPHTLSATFVLREFTLTPITRGGGSVTPNVTTTVPCGSDFTFHFSPYDGYYVSGVVVNGDTLPASDSCLLTGIMANHTVQPLFSLLQFQITATAGEGGSVSPEYAVVDYQGLQTVHITADDCYHIDSVFVDDHYVTPTAVYTFNNVTDDHTLRATFAMDTYTLTASVEGAGTVIPVGDTMVNCGENVTYTVLPSDGWHLEELLVDGAAVASTETFTFTDVRDNHRIAARFAINEYTVTTTAGEGGTVTPEVAEAPYGDSVAIAIIADDCYHIDSVFVDEVYSGRDSSYTFRNISEDYKLRATFAMDTYTLTASVEGEGTITPEGETTVNCGESTTYSITPETGWHLTEVRVDGEPVDSTESYTFMNIHASHTIKALFAIDEYTVTATANEGGSVVPQSTVAHFGDSVRVVIIANDCYHIDSVFVDEVYAGRDSSYTFRDITGDHTLRAVFAIDTYVITASLEGNGTITPAGETVVNCDENITYSITVADGWSLAELLVDDEPVELTDSYTFTGVRTDHSIFALLIGDEYTVKATAGEGGTVTPERTFVNFGDSVTIKVTADECHHIDSIFVDEVYAGSDSNYTFRDISEDHTFRAVLAANTYTLTALAEGEGSITPAGEATVDCGEDATYTFIADEGWHLANLLVDGVSVDSTESYTFTNIRANHTIKALFAIDQYTVTATAGEGGTVTPEHAVVDRHGRLTIRITADNCYHIDSVFVDGHYVGSARSYTFNNVVDNHTLRAVFAINTYTIAASVEGEGTIMPEGETAVNCGGNATYTFAAAEGWHLAEVRVDDVPVDSTESYTFTNTRTNHTITVSFAINEYTVTATAGEGGSVTPESTVVNYGDSVAIAITADDCYHIDSVFVDEVYAGNDSSYTFRNIADDHTLYATFAIDTYTLTASVEGEGTITPEGTATVNCGESTTYSITPETGWHLTELRVDGETVENTDSYTFTDVRANHSITALFAINEYTVTATAGEGGSVTPESTVVNYGDSVTIEITVDDCYHIDSVFVDEVYAGSDSSYTFRNVDANHSIRATFAQNLYDVQVLVVSEDNHVFFDTLLNLQCGLDTMVGIPLFHCFYIDSIDVNGVMNYDEDSVFIQNIHEDMNIVFYLSREQFIIIASKQGSGTVSPMDTVHVFCDDVVTFTFTPDEGWYVQNVVVDGVDHGTPSNRYYTFYNVNANHTIEVVFVQNMYIITSSIDPIDAGQITPFGQTVVNYGEDQTFNITSWPGYEVIDVEVDGVSHGAITTYTFHHVEANHTIVAHLTTVGVEEAVENKEVAVWPNPVENVCHIQLPGMRNIEIQLFDAQGKLILRNRVDSDEVEIDFVGKPSGMYLLRVVSDGEVIATRKVIRK